MKHTTAHPICEDRATRQLKSIPEHWHIRRLKFVANIVAGQSPPSEIVTDYDGSFPFLQGNAEFGTTTPAPRFSCQTPNKRAQRGDILLSVRAPVGAINTADQDYGIGRGLCAISPTTHINENFLDYTLQVTKISLSKVATGSTYDAVTVGQVGDIPTPLPPPSEQAAIVSYLDHADELIARYISAKQRLIALLEEQRQAVIHQAVTRGLDPSVTLKASGVEWLGEVPEHWEVRRIKSLTAVKRGASPRPIDDPQYFCNSGEYAWVRIADVTASKHFLETTTQKLSKLGQSLSVQLQPGALFMSIAGSVGKPMITKIKCCIHDGFVYFPGLEGNQAFMYQILSTSSPLLGLGKLGTQLNLNTDTVGGICVAYPPISERRQITAFLEDSSTKYDKAISRARHQIDLMNEYRTRLIADVVTGQIDVRDAAVELPS